MSTPANNKSNSKPSLPNTLNVPTTTQENTETAETYRYTLLEIIFVQIEQLKPLLAAHKKATRNIVTKMLASTQELLGEILVVM